MTLITFFRSVSVVAIGISMCFGEAQALQQMKAEASAYATRPKQATDMVEKEGDDNLKSRELVSGVTYRRADETGNPGEAYWFTSLGIARSAEEFAKLSTCLDQARMVGFTGDFVFSGENDTEYTAYSEMGVGKFATRKEAQAFVDIFPSEIECRPSVRNSGMYAFDKTQPTIVHVLEIEPGKFDGRLVAARGSAAAVDRTKPSDVLQRFAAGVAATNGGYFVMESSDGLVGESAGISVQGGRMLSEPTKGRPWVSIKNASRIEVRLNEKEPAEPTALVSANGKMLLIDGVNRKPGVLRNCGSLYDKAFATAIHDKSCPTTNEIVVMTNGSGIEIDPSKDTVIYRLGLNKRLELVDKRKAPGPSDTILVATGNKRTELADFATSRGPMQLSFGAFITDGQTYAMNGGPTLLANGKAVKREAEEGWPFGKASLVEAMDMHRFINMRAPRTAIGVTASGNILLVVVDGWRFGTDTGPKVPMSGGATIDELTSILLKLGAQDAMNLDGGGSSAMVLKEGVVSNPSDSDGERAVGDSFIILSNQVK